jgi:hypothetical protein
MAAIEAEIDSSKGQKGIFVPIKLLETLAQYRLGDPRKNASTCAELAEALLKKGDYYKARYCLEVEAKWHRIRKDEAAELGATRRIGEAFVAESEGKAQGESVSFMVASNFMVQGIEALRQAREPQERIKALKKRLAHFQEKSLEEMKPMHFSIDIAEAVNAAQEQVKGKTFPEAVAVLVLGSSLCKPTKLRAEALTIAAEHPISHLFPRVMVDHKGRAIAKRGAVLGSESERQEEEVTALMFENAAQFHWSVRAEAFINPARIQILNDHRPSFSDIAPLIQYNPFVPPGHETLILRGLHAGFHGDLVLATHLLVPQIENSLRYILEGQGVDVSNLLSDGTQPVKILGTLLALPQAKEILGDDLVFELQGHLLEKTAFDLRNRLAHGFVTEDECSSVPGLCVWWLVLRICVQARAGHFQKQASDVLPPAELSGADLPPAPEKKEEE